MGKKILLADDSITIQKVIELTFSDEDFEVVSVGNGRLAVERFQEVRPDVVLCDIIMPEKDGYEVCDFIKKHPQLAATPVLLLTGAFEPFDQERAARVGCDGYLAKPFEPQTLIGKVKELLAQGGRRAASPARPAAAASPAAPAPAALPASASLTSPSGMPSAALLSPPPLPAPPAPSAAPAPSAPPPPVWSAPPTSPAPPAPPSPADYQVFYPTPEEIEPLVASPEFEPVFAPSDFEPLEPVEPLVPEPPPQAVAPQPAAWPAAPEPAFIPEDPYEDTATVIFGAAAARESAPPPAPHAPAPSAALFPEPDLEPPVHVAPPEPVSPEDLFIAEGVELGAAPSVEAPVDSVLEVEAPTPAAEPPAPEVSPWRVPTAEVPLEERAQAAIESAYGAAAALRAPAAPVFAPPTPPAYTPPAAPASFEESFDEPALTLEGDETAGGTLANIPRITPDMLPPRPAAAPVAAEPATTIEAPAAGTGDVLEDMGLEPEAAAASDQPAAEAALSGDDALFTALSEEEATPEPEPPVLPPATEVEGATMPLSALPEAAAAALASAPELPVAAAVAASLDEPADEIGDELSFEDVRPAEAPAGAGRSEAAGAAVPVDQVEQIARRVVGQLSEKVIREVAWEVVPELAEALIKRELERLRAELDRLP